MSDPTLKARLRADLTSAIRDRDRLRSSTLRMVLTAITNEEVAGQSARELTDDDVLKVLNREAKKRREAATAYTGASRPELAAQEEAELLILQGYLPAQLSDEQLDGLVARAVQDSQATGMSQLGLVMKAVQPLVAGRAEGGRVAAAVRRALIGY